jgi:hypothetical protein
VSAIRQHAGSVSSGYSESELDDDEAASFVDAPERLSTDDMICENCGPERLMRSKYKLVRIRERPN